MKRFDEGGSVVLNYSTGPTRKITVEDEFATIEAILDNPALQLREIQALVYETTGNSISIPTMSQWML